MKTKLSNWLDISQPADQNGCIKLVDYFVDFIDALTVRVCPLLLTIGFIIGTIATFSTDFNFNESPTFNLVWSICQAVAIDGLFFSVWSLWRRSGGKGWIRWWYGLVGSLLACTVALVNNIVSFSELEKYHTIAQSMKALNIDASAFTYTRATLIALVAILMITLPREKATHDASTNVPVHKPTNTAAKNDTGELEQVTVPVQEAANALGEPVCCMKNVPESVPESIEREQTRYGNLIEEMYLNNPNITAREIVDTIHCT